MFIFHSYEIYQIAASSVRVDDYAPSGETPYRGSHWRMGKPCPLVPFRTPVLEQVEEWEAGDVNETGSENSEPLKLFTSWASRTTGVKCFA